MSQAHRCESRSSSERRAVLSRARGSGKVRTRDHVGGGVRVVLALFLLVGPLPAHAPVCKVAVANARSQPVPAPGGSTCCARCQQKPAERSAPVTPKKPAKPACPANCVCPLCVTPPALVAAPLASAEYAGPAIERLRSS